MRNNKPLSLEDTIRAVHNQHKNRPSPLLMIREDSNIHMSPTQVPDNMRQAPNIRDQLLNNFIPTNNRFS